jgi:hypothetical protein
VLPSVLPRFVLLVACPEREVAGKLAERLATPECDCVGWVEGAYAELHVRVEDRHFWSPRLQVTLIEDPEGTLVHGTFRPEPEVWTGFVFAHCVFAAVALAGLSLGLAQSTLGAAPTAMLGTVAGGLASLGLYFGALAGHRVGHDQMDMLRRDFDYALDCLAPRER